MFNLSGSEIIVILLLALVVLGPEKLPDAMRRAGKTFAEIKKLSSGFQDEVRKGFEEPAREVKKTAASVKSAARFPTITGTSSDKPTYNPATDPPPQQPEGSSVAEPLVEASPDAESVAAGDQAAADAPDAAVDESPAAAAVPDAPAAVAAGDSPEPDRGPAPDVGPAPVTEADRTA